MKKAFTALTLGMTLWAAPALAASDSVRVGLVLEPPHLDPTAGAAAAIDEVVYANIYEGLTRFDANGAIKPALAKSWTVSSDGLIYTFKLRTGATFHDGTSFDSADVKFSIDRAMADKSVNAQKKLFEPIASVETPNADTVVITLKRATGHFLFNMGWGDAVIVAPESATTNKSKPVGTGPFKFAKWTKGDSIKMVRNDSYWGTPVKLKSATLKYISDPTAAMAAMMAGDVDAFSNFPSPESLGQFTADPRFDVVIGSTEGETILAINNGKKPFNDVRVRRAIAFALNRQAIVDGAMFGYGTPIGTHFAPHHPAYVDMTDMYAQDLAKSKKLLAEAGYPNGFKATIKLPPPTYARRGGEIIAAQLAKVGIQLEIIPVEWGQWLKQAFKGRDFDLTIVSHTEPMDIGIYTRDTYYFDYHSDALKAVMAKLDAAVDQKDRYALMGEAQKIVANDSVNGFLFQLAKHGVWKKNLKGMWHNAPTQATDLTGVYWAK